MGVILTVAETCDRLRITPQKLYQLRYRNLGPRATRIGKRGIVFREEEIERWLNKQTEAKPGEVA